MPCPLTCHARMIRAGSSVVLSTLRRPCIEPVQWLSRSSYATHPPASSRAQREPEHRVQYNYDVFELHPEQEHYTLPLVTASDLAKNKTRPRSVRMLARDFIHDSLYHPHYGYFSRQAVLLPPTKSTTKSQDAPSTSSAVFPFHDIKNETEFMRLVQLRYMEFENQFQEANKARERARRKQQSEPTLQERIEALQLQQRRASWGTAAYMDLAREIGRLQKEQSQDQVSDAEVDAMAAGQVWHTPTQLFSPYYGRALARYLVAEYKLHLFPYHDLILYELGGGAGTLARDILDYIEECEPDVYARTRYHIVEISARLAAQQRERLATHAQHGVVHVVHRDFLQWKERVNDPCFVIALEVLDNLTHDVVRYSTDDLQPYQGLVSIDHTGDFVELWEPVKDPLILSYLQMLRHVRPTVLPPGAPFYLGWIPQSVRRYLHDNAPFYPNLTQPHYIPTGALQMLEVLRKHFPLHRLVLSDFSSLPDACAGVNAPVVQTRHNGAMIPVTTYCVLQGFFDIFFPTDFELLRDMYLHYMSTPTPPPMSALNAGIDEGNIDVSQEHRAQFPPSFFSPSDLPERPSLYENFSSPMPRFFASSDIIPPPLLSDSREARIMSHAEFLTRYAEAQGTELRDGSNPMIACYRASMGPWPLALSANCSSGVVVAPTAARSVVTIMSAPVKERPSTAGRITLGVGIVLFLHAAFSTYEFLSQGKSLDLGTGSTKYESAIPSDMMAELLISFAVLVVGCAMTTPALRPISWSTRMRETSIDRVDGRSSFANVRHRGAHLFGTRT